MLVVIELSIRKRKAHRQEQQNLFHTVEYTKKISPFMNLDLVLLKNILQIFSGQTVRQSVLI